MKVACRAKKDSILSFPSQFTLKAAVGWGRVEKACCIVSVLAGCVHHCFFLCDRQNENVIYNLFHLYALLPGRYMTEENLKSRMFIILIMHGHYSHSLAQWVGMSWKKYTHSLNVEEVGTLEVLGSIALWWRGDRGWAACSTISGCSHGYNGPHWVKSVMEKGVKGVKGLCGDAEGTHAKQRL